MRRSTRFSTKRAPVSSDSSDEDEPKKAKPEPKINKKATSSFKKAIQKENYNSESDVESKSSENKKPNQEENLDSSSSESDIENYLQPVDQIDLDSTFFKVNKPDEQKSFDDIENNIFAGINRLSESESEEELETNVDLHVKKSETKEPKTKDSKAASSKLNFQQLHDYTTKLEEAKKLVEKYEASKRAKLGKKPSNKKSEEENLDISDLLALGEAKINPSVELRGSLHSSDFESHSDSEKEDWEEVEGHDIKETKESIVPKDGVEITVELPGGVARKKKGIDLIACMKRRLNKIKKENQVLVHKVHLLCWLAHGNYVNNVLNNESVLAMALSLIPSQHCYPSDRTDLNYLEQIVKWYKNSMPYVEKQISKEMTLEKILHLQITRKRAFNKKMLVYIFICILRSLGIQCRLVLSFQVAPLRPPASELHSFSTKSEDKKNKDQKVDNTKEDSSQKSNCVKGSKGDNKETKGKIQKMGLSKEQQSKKPSLANLSSKDGIKNRSETQTRQTKMKEPSNKPNLKTVSERIGKNSSKSNKEANRVKTKEHKSKNKGNSDLKRTTDNSQASTSKTNQQESCKVERHSKSSNDKKSQGKPSKTEHDIKSDIIDNSKSQTEDVKSKNNESPTQSPSSTPLKIPQVDGAEDSDEPSTSQKSRKLNLKKLSQEETNPCPTKKHPKRLKSLPNSIKEDSDKNLNFRSSKTTISATHSDSKSSTNFKKLNPVLKPVHSPSKGSKRESSKKPDKSQDYKKPSASTNLKNLKQKPGSKANLRLSKSLDRERSQYFSVNVPRKPGDVRSDIISLMKGRMAQERSIERSKLIKSRRFRNESDYDSDYAPEPVKKKRPDSDDEFYEKNKVKIKQRVKVRKDGDEEETPVKKGVDVWVEVYLEAEEKWISADVIKERVHCIKELYSKASHPVTYIVAWNNDNSIKDITQRYCPNWNTVTRKLRIDKKWWEDTLRPFEGRKTARDREEDEELARLQLEQPLPTAISEYKSHPLYVLKRHLLKFEALYPPDPITLGFVRGEPVYSRECVHTLHSREVWIKYAKVVKPGEQPYKIVKARAKYDKLSGQMITDQALEVFGKWQVEDYVPPTAENGIVPRNVYGNVDLFKRCMLPKGTVHLQLPGLNKLARRMNIDCAPAVVGFDFHSGGSHPTFDGFVVCEEHSESLIAAWYMEQEEQEKREKEKREKRIYGNWKKLIRGLLIRERLKARYDFGEPSQSGTGSKRKSKGSKLVPKKRRICSESESD